MSGAAAIIAIDDDDVVAVRRRSSRAWAPQAALQFTVAINRFFQYNVLVDLFNNACDPTQYFAMACLLWVIGADAAVPYILNPDRDYTRKTTGSLRIACYFVTNLLTGLFSFCYIVIFFYMAVGPGLEESPIRPASLVAAAVTQSVMASIAAVSFCYDACNQEAASKAETASLTCNSGRPGDPAATPTQAAV